MHKMWQRMSGDEKCYLCQFARQFNFDVPSLLQTVSQRGALKAKLSQSFCASYHCNERNLERPWYGFGIQHFVISPMPLTTWLLSLNTPGTFQMKKLRIMGHLWRFDHHTNEGNEEKVSEK